MSRFPAEGQLPFLFKVLSVNKSLSIQAHPNKVIMFVCCIFNIFCQVLRHGIWINGHFRTFYQCTVELQLHDQISFSGENCFVRIHVMWGSTCHVICQAYSSILISFICLEIDSYCQDN